MSAETMKTIEQMARAAGITVGIEPKGGALGMFVPKHYLEAFASLVAERCVQIVGQYSEGRFIIDEIRTEFPKP